VAWVTPRVRRLAREITPPSPAAVGDRLNRRLYEVFSHDGLPALLRYADRNAMAHSVEARMPFMDYRLVGYLFSLPAEDKIRDGQTKHVLRRGLASLLPRRILDRHDKIGFLTPEEQWFRGPLRWIFEDVIGSASLARRGYCDPARLRALRAAHSAGRVNASMPLWRAVNLELWFRRFVDAAG
jgi:asparagine synthase (glutamine-hydrolysing)